MSEPSGPAMAIILISYRHENYVADALRGAFAQTYSPLDIVVSDDASPDGTWRVIEEEVARYRGPHRVILNRNQVNLGVVGNIKRAVSLTSAPYLVLAAGDDISEPHRVARIAERFADRDVKFVTSHVTVMDAAGHNGAVAPVWDESTPITAEALTKIETAYVVGCAAAYAREVFDLFPEFHPSVTIEEDLVLPFRAVLLGRAAYVPEALVRYRQHAQSLTEVWRDTTNPMVSARNFKSLAAGYVQKIADLEYCKTRFGERRAWFESLESKCHEALAETRYRMQWQTPGPRGLLTLAAGAASGRIDLRLAAKTFLRLYFPRSWYRYVAWRQRVGS